MEYAVIWAEALRGRYLELLAEATARGQRQEVLAATRFLVERLQDAPPAALERSPIISPPGRRSIRPPKGSYP
jgi:hypothetical protein